MNYNVKKYSNFLKQDKRRLDNLEKMDLKNTVFDVEKNQMKDHKLNGIAQANAETCRAS